MLNDFIIHNNLPKDLPFPKGNMTLDCALSLILDIIVRSMGDKKRDEILMDLEDYKKSLDVLGPH